MNSTQLVRFTSGFAIVCLSCVYAQQVNPSAVSTTPDAIALAPFEVSAESAAGYGATTTSSATRMNTPLREVPQTINVITDKFMEDIFAFDNADATRYVPNVSRRTANHQPNAFMMRGFLTTAVFQDGFRITEANRDMANIARVEVIKGPASATVGRGEVGGAISFVSKRPLPVKQASLQATFGGENLVRIVGDLTGPVNDARTVNYRVIALYHDTDDIKPYIHTTKRAVYPSLEWRIAPRTTLNIAIESSHITAPMNSGRTFITSKVGGSSPGLPEAPTRREFFKGEPWDERVDDVNTGNASLVHTFNDIFSTRQAVQVLDSSLAYTWALGGITSTRNATTGDISINRTSRVGSTDARAYRYQGDFLAKYEGIGGKHQTLVGAEYEHALNQSFLMQGALTPINYTNPVYGAFPTNLAVVANSTTDNTADSIGLIAQHQSSFFANRLSLIAGLRWDDRKSVTDYMADTRADAVGKFGNPTISPRYGITITPIPELSLYAVHSIDDQPTSTSNRYNLLPAGDPRLLETISGSRTGTLDEFGVKAELFKGRVSATFAAYKMTRVNQLLSVVKTLPNGAAYNEFFLSAGELVKGYETQFFGQISSRLDFLASYAFTPTSTNVISSGVKNIAGIPKEEMSFFASYRFHDKGQDGFSIRAGYNRIGKMWGHLENLWRFGPQERADAGISYTKGRYRFDLQVNNVFDDDYFPSAVASDNLAETSPRQMMVSVTRRFF